VQGSVQSRVVALALAGMAGCTAEATPRDEAGFRRVPVRLVQVASASSSRSIGGTVSSSSHATISTRISATVASVAVREGDRVARGALLVRLADADLRAQLGAARVVLETARAAERRARVLAEGGHVPASALDAARAQRAQAEGQVAALRETLAYTEIRAPFAGAVLAKLVSPGVLVNPGQPLVELSGTELEIVAQVSEDEARHLSAGQKVPFESGDSRGDAIVSAISPGGDAISHRGILRARIVASGPSVRPGDFARLEIPSEEAVQRLWVPRTAIVQRGDLNGVFLVREGRAELRWLALGDDRAPDAVSVRAGVRPGDAVVDDPGGLRDGDPVEVASGH
jgi:membrane fusion protein, multidrug efflux system